MLLKALFQKSEAGVMFIMSARHQLQIGWIRRRDKALRLKQLMLLQIRRFSNDQSAGHGRLA
jgi:hypothetical protein